MGRNYPRSPPTHNLDNRPTTRGDRDAQPGNDSSLTVRNILGRSSPTWPAISNPLR